MAEKKKAETKKKSETKKKKAEVSYNGKEYSVLEEVNGRLKLTDGTIHFWVKAEKIERVRYECR